MSEKSKKMSDRYPRKIELPMHVRCLKCDKVVDSCVSGESAWDMPDESVVFHGGLSFGSNFLDALVDGVMVKIIICDDCIKMALDVGKALKYKVNKEEIVIGGGK